MGKLILNNVSKIYPNGMCAVDNISLEIDDRELLILVGPSGCGKTTTLRMIAGLEDVTSGNIYIEGKRINDLSPRKRDVAMVFQNYALYPHMTVYQNLAFALKMQKIPRKVIDKMVEDTANLLGITNILQSKPGLLSGGQQQRVALGRAIIRRPKIFLFDEPLSNLDTHLRAKMRTELSRLHTKLATTMIYVTHDQLEAMTMGEKIVVMNMGKVLQIGDPITIYERPANKFVAGFFGSPPINFFEGRIVSKEQKLFFESKDVLFPIACEKRYKLAHHVDKKVIMGLRSEHIMSPGKSPTSCGFCLDTFVEVIEPMGPATIVYFSSGRHDFVARFDTGNSFKVGDSLQLCFCLDKSLFFDFETEHSIL